MHACMRRARPPIGAHAQRCRARARARTLARHQIKLDYASISEIFVYDMANNINTK